MCDWSRLFYTKAINTTETNTGGHARKRTGMNDKVTRSNGPLISCCDYYWSLLVPHFQAASSSPLHTRAYAMVERYKDCEL
jgi:hypothetical protein